MQKVGVREPIPGVVYLSENRLRAYAEAGVLTDETLVSAFRDVVGRFPDRVAVSEVDRTISFAGLDVLTDKAAAAFLRLGLNPLDRVLFQLQNSADLVIAVVACLKAGLIPVCTLAAHRQHEIGYLGRHAQSRAHLLNGCDRRFDFIAFARQMRKEIPSLDFSIATGADGASLPDGAISFADMIAAEDASEARERLRGIAHDPFQVALFQLSGGTTAVPKIIPRFHNEYLYTMRTVVRRHGLDETTVAYTPNPHMHNAPMACLWGPALFFGGEVAIAQTLDADEIGPLMMQRRPNWLLVPPPILFRLKEKEWLDKIDFSDAKGFSVTEARAKFMKFVSGAPTWPLFGMTEGLLAYGNRGDSEEALNTTVGRPLSPHDEVRILQPDTEDDVPPGEIGELAVRGPCTIAGYFDAEERNAEAFTGDEFYRSGDLMRMKTIDGRNYLIFEGRIKDVVSRGGEKINCQEVERAASNHPAIAAISVVAMPDPVYGERACAFVIPVAGRTVDVASLGRHLGEHGLAKFKWPERVELVDEFPLTSSGKLSKPRLRDAIAAKLAAAAAA